MTASVAAWERNSPFDPCSEDSYRRWRDRKLADLPPGPEALAVDLARPYALTAAERQALLGRCQRWNMAVYRTTEAGDKDQARAIARQLGLRRLERNLCADDDGIASLRVVEAGRPREYIPYSNRPINWHTDGYYNGPGQQVRAVLMHCVRDAAQGGGNLLLDPELVYIALRDQDPAYVAVLMQPDAMTIPANQEEGAELRAAQPGPVLSVDRLDGTLHMRYTARKRSIEWRSDALTREAVGFLETMLAASNPHVLYNRLTPGQGLVCNNVLHTREGFVDGATPGGGRLLLRARFFERVAVP